MSHSSAPFGSGLSLSLSSFCFFVLMVILLFFLGCFVFGLVLLFVIVCPRFELAGRHVLIFDPDG